MAGGAKRSRHSPGRRCFEFARTCPGRGRTLFEHARAGSERRQFAPRFDEVDRQRFGPGIAALAYRVELRKLTVGDAHAAAELSARFGMSAQRTRSEEALKSERRRLALSSRRMEVTRIELRKL
ncbi:MAG: hypothetical protein M3R40_11150, partial [Pseudomonadota bacterium]|nr:hypothetical protein [Pseudomonadota bacterium]